MKILFNGSMNVFSLSSNSPLFIGKTLRLLFRYHPIIIFIFLLIPIYSAIGDISIEDEIKYREIIVVRGEEFTVCLKGKGWYLNRYDRDNLYLRSRKLRDQQTCFTIYPLHTGIAYLLFSYLDRDVYLLINILETPSQSDTVRVEDGIKVSEEKPQDEVLDKELKDAEEMKELTGEESAPPDIETENSEYTEDSKGLLTQEPSVYGQEEQEEREEKSIDVKGLEEQLVSSKEGEDIGEQKGLSEAEAEAGKVTFSLEEKQEKLEIKDKKTDEIYYIDKDEKKIIVPDKQEKDPFKKGIDQFKKGQKEKAIESLMEYLSKCENCSYSNDAHFTLAEIYIDRNNESEAIKHLSEVLSSKSDKFKREAYQKKAELDYKAGRLLESLEGYGYVLEMDRNNFILQRIVGDVYYEIKEYDKALDHYENAIKLGFLGDEVFYRVAKIYDGQGKERDMGKAYKYYKIIIDRYTNSEHYTFAKQRAIFLERNFFDYR